MAGIGFELKKLFRKRGILAKVVAVGYTGMVTTGPLILGLLYLLAVSWLGGASGLTFDQMNDLLVMITYDMLASQLAYGAVSMVATRYVSDALYGNGSEQVVPSLVGVLCVTLPVSGLVWLAFLLASGLGGGLVLLNEMLFLSLTAVWLEMGYLTAVTDYKGVLGAYAVSTLTSVALVWWLCADGDASMELLLACVCLGYGLMMVLGLVLLGRSFPAQGGRCFGWLAWADRYPQLVVIGVCTCVGLFAHLVIGWANPAVSSHVMGPFYTAPEYDIPALYAVLTMIPTTITFVSSTEVEFYPTYRRYFDLLNGTGSISQIDAAQTEMLVVLRRELSRLARRQLLFSLGAIGFGTLLLDILPLGFTPFMNARFCILCVGYGLYAVANVLSLMLMYFSDYQGASRAAVWFAACVVVTSLVALFLPADWLGWGFVLSSAVYGVMTLRSLVRYLDRLPLAVFLAQPSAASQEVGPFERLGSRLERVL